MRDLRIGIEDKSSKLDKLLGYEVFLFSKYRDLEWTRTLVNRFKAWIIK